MMVLWPVHLCCFTCAFHHNRLGTSSWPSYQPVYKCESFSVNDLSRFPNEMKKSNVPHFDILGAPIGDFLFCAKYIAQKRTDASKLLQQLAK